MNNLDMHHESQRSGILAIREEGRSFRLRRLYNIVTHFMLADPMTKHVGYVSKSLYELLTSGHFECDINSGTRSHQEVLLPTSIRFGMMCEHSQTGIQHGLSRLELGTLNFAFTASLRDTITHDLCHRVVNWRCRELTLQMRRLLEHRAQRQVWPTLREWELVFENSAHSIRDLL